MFTQREIDILHIQAQEYQAQVREEFQRGLMGKRGKNELPGQNQSQEAAGVPRQTELQSDRGAAQPTKTTGLY